MYVYRHISGYIGFAILVLLVFTFVSGCSQKKLIPSCLECPHQKQQWDDFAWDALEGHWQGTIEVDIDRMSDTKKKRRWQKVDFKVVSQEAFAGKGCTALPLQAKVVMHETWTMKKRKSEQVFEVFAREAKNHVSYGRLVLEKDKCSYIKFPGALSMNLMEMPAKRFTQKLRPDGRMLASGVTPEVEVDLEFLRFAAEAADEKVALTDAKHFRGPASAMPKEYAPWMFRVVKTVKHLDKPFARGEWAATEEYIYRMWKVK